MQQLLFPLDQRLHAVVPTRKQRRRARELSELLDETGDVARWCERTGYRFRELDLPPDIPAALMNGWIFIGRGLTKIEKILFIAHEIFHHEFHGSAIAYKELPDGAINFSECQAESFAVLVAEPSMLRYATMDEFRAATKLPPAYRKLREELYYRVKG